MQYFDEKSGFITTITGPMFSEKSGELVKRCKKIENFRRKKVIAFKPSLDTRFSSDEIVSRVGLKMKATLIPAEIDEKLYYEILEKTKLCDVVAFDEAQFFSNQIVALVNELANQGKIVIVSGLNLSYKGKSFGFMSEIMSLSDEIINLKAYCSLCGRPAIFTQRLIDNKPAKEGPLTLVGDTESYEARCRLCFVSPDLA